MGERVSKAFLIFWESHSHKVTKLPFVLRIHSNSWLFLLQDKAGYPGKLSPALSLLPVKLEGDPFLSALQDNRIPAVTLEEKCRAKYTEERSQKKLALWRMIPALCTAVVGTRENKHIRQRCKQRGESQTDTGTHRADAKPAEVNENPRMDVPDDFRTVSGNRRDKGKDPGHWSVCSEDSSRHWASQNNAQTSPLSSPSTCSPHMSSWRGRKPTHASCSTGTLPTRLAASSAAPPCWRGFLSDGVHYAWQSWCVFALMQLSFYSKRLQINPGAWLPVVPGILGADRQRNTLGGCSHLLPSPPCLSGIFSLCCTNPTPWLLQQQQVSGPFAPFKERMEAVTPQEAPCSKWFLT